MILRPAVNKQDRRPIRVPHSRTCNCTPPPPVTVWICVALCDWCHLRPPRARRCRRIVAVRSRAHRAQSLIFGLRPSIFGWRVLSSGEILAAWRSQRERRSSDASAGSRNSSARSMRRGPRAARRCSSLERRVSARPCSRQSSRRGPVAPDSRSFRALPRSRRHGASLPAVRRGIAPARRAAAGRCGDGGLTVAGVRGDPRAAGRARGGRARAARARGSALGGCVDARSRRLPRAQPRRPADSAPRDVSRGRTRVGRACAPTRRRRPALWLGARARARTAGARGADDAAHGSRRRPAAGSADERDRRTLRGQCLLRRGAPRRRGRARGASSRVACATCCCSASRSSTPRRRASCAWPRPPDATWATRCSARRRRSRSPTSASRCAGRSTTASSSPSRRRGASASATPCSPKRSTRRSCLASGRNFTRASPRARAQRSCIAGGARAALGGGGPQHGGARRVGRSGAPGRGRLRPRRGPGAPRAGAGALARGPGCGRARRARSRRALHLDGQLAGEVGAAAPCGRARAASDRARRRRRPAPCGAPPCAPRSNTSTRPAVPRLSSPRSSARSSSCRRSRPRRSARMRWDHSREG